MAGFSTILRIVVQRALGNRRLLAAVVTGVVLSSALMASVVMYSDAIRDLGLRYALRRAEPRTLDLQIASSSAPLRRQEYAIRRETTDRLLDRFAGDIVEDSVHAGRSATFFLTQPGAPVTEEPNRPRAHFVFAERINQHVTVVQGAPYKPAEPARQGAAPAFEVWIGRATADRLGVQAGQSYDLHPFWRLEAAPLRITVAGIVEPTDPADRFWFGRDDRMQVTGTSWPTYPFIVDERTLVEVVAPYLPDIDATFETFAYVDRGRIGAANATAVENRVRTLEAALRQNLERTTLVTALPDTISTYRTKLFFTRLPLFALIAQVVAIVLYYLIMVSTMVVERQAGEVALLKSRGASTTQIMIIYLLEGLILCAIAATLGPLIAAAGIALLGPTPPFRDLSEGGLLNPTLSAGAYVLALLGALLALGALIWPAYRGAARSIVHYKQAIARPQRQPAFLRYYLDLALIGVGALAFYQLRQRGSLVTEKLFGELSADPLLLATPALFMLMIALVFLRLFPLALRLVAWAARGLNGATLPLGLARMVRSPVHYTRLILLLILATAVGMFAAGFRATLERSYDDRAAYQAGAPARIENIRTPSAPTNNVLVDSLTRATGAGVVSPVLRISGTWSATLFRTEDFTMLGVVPDDIARIAFWRDDFAGDSLRGMLNKLEGGVRVEEGITVPANARYLGVWVRTALGANAAQLGVRLQEPTGAFWEYRLLSDGAPNAEGWQFYVADLGRPLQPGARTGQTPTPNTAKRMDALFVRVLGTPQTPERATVLFDDVQVSTSADLPAGWPLNGFTSPQVIEDFEDLGRYELVTGASATADPGALSRAEGGRDGRFAARVAFTRQRGGTPLTGLRVRGSGDVLPVLTSSSFLEATNLKTGDDFTVYVNRQYVPVRAVGTFDYFPTYDPGRPTHLLITDLAALQAAASRVPSLSDGAYANEAWLGDLTGEPISKESLAAKGVNAEVVIDQAVLRAQQSADPLVAASWEGILFLAFATVLGLTALAFTVYAYLSAQTRALEFAILRTMGYSSRQILALVGFEQIFVIGAGVAAGTLLGLPLGRLMIGYMGFTESGATVLPPLVSRVSWQAVATTYGALALMMLGAIAALAWIYSRLALHRALRMGEL